MVYDAKAAIVDDLIASTAKTLQDYQPHWTFAAGYRDHQLSWPVLEEDSGVTRSQIRFRIPEEHPEYCSISYLHRGDPVCRLDRDSDDVCKANHPFARQVGLSPEVCGLHIHSWPDNRQYILATNTWDIPLRRQVDENLSNFEQMFYWFCTHINVRIQPHNTPIQLPDVGLWRH